MKNNLKNKFLFLLNILSITAITPIFLGACSKNIQNELQNQPTIQTKQNQAIVVENIKETFFNLKNIYKNTLLGLRIVSANLLRSFKKLSTETNKTEKVWKNFQTNLDNLKIKSEKDDKNIDCIIDFLSTSNFKTEINLIENLLKTQIIKIQNLYKNNEFDASGFKINLIEINELNNFQELKKIFKNFSIVKASQPTFLDLARFIQDSKNQIISFLMAEYSTPSNSSSPKASEILKRLQNLSKTAGQILLLSTKHTLQTVLVAKVIANITEQKDLKELLMKVQTYNNELISRINLAKISEEFILNIQVFQKNLECLMAEWNKINSPETTVSTSDAQKFEALKIKRRGARPVVSVGAIKAIIDYSFSDGIKKISDLMKLVKNINQELANYPSKIISISDFNKIFTKSSLLSKNESNIFKRASSIIENLIKIDASLKNLKHLDFDKETTSTKYDSLISNTMLLIKNQQKLILNTFNDNSVMKHETNSAWLQNQRINAIFWFCSNLLLNEAVKLFNLNVADQMFYAIGNLS